MTAPDEDFIDCTQDDHLIEDTDNGPDPELDGPQDDVDQDPIAEDDVEDDTDVESDPLTEVASP